MPAWCDNPSQGRRQTISLDWTVDLGPAMRGREANQSQWERVTKRPLDLLFLCVSHTVIAHRAAAAATTNVRCLMPLVCVCVCKSVYLCVRVCVCVRFGLASSRCAGWSDAHRRPVCLSAHTHKCAHMHTHIHTHAAAEVIFLIKMSVRLLQASLGVFFF